MKGFQATQKLDVYRRLSTGQKILAGQLAQNNRATYFQYNAAYLEHYHSLSPFKPAILNLGRYQCDNAKSA